MPKRIVGHTERGEIRACLYEEIDGVVDRLADQRHAEAESDAMDRGKASATEATPASAPETTGTKRERERGAERYR